MTVVAPVWWTAHCHDEGPDWLSLPDATSLAFLLPLLLAGCSGSDLSRSQFRRALSFRSAFGGRCPGNAVWMTPTRIRTHRRQAGWRSGTAVWLDNLALMPARKIPAAFTLVFDHRCELSFSNRSGFHGNHR